MRPASLQRLFEYRKRALSRFARDFNGAPLKRQLLTRSRCRKIGKRLFIGCNCALAILQFEFSQSFLPAIFFAPLLTCRPVFAVLSTKCADAAFVTHRNVFFERREGAW